MYSETPNLILLKRKMEAGPTGLNWWSPADTGSARATPTPQSIINAAGHHIMTVMRPWASCTRDSGLGGGCRKYLMNFLIGSRGCLEWPSLCHSAQSGGFESHVSRKFANGVPITQAFLGKRRNTSRELIGGRPAGRGTGLENQQHVMSVLGVRVPWPPQ